jgi:hypothetical protein
MDEKQFEKPRPLRIKAYSPGSSQGLDACRLEKMVAANEQVSEQAYESSIFPDRYHIPRYMPV